MDALFRRLRHYAEIGEAEENALASLPVERDSFDAGADIVTRGQTPSQAFVVSSGWASRNISLPDGRSQIVNFMLPGDLYDLQAFIAKKADHSITALTQVEILRIEPHHILNLFDGRTRAGTAFWWATLQEEAILREHVVRNGRRTARERIAHLILELHRRAVIVGQGQGDRFELPISQVVIADALGLSFVHVNRVIRSLVKDGYIGRDKHAFILLDRKALAEIADFNQDYLHLDADPCRLLFTAQA